MYNVSDFGAVGDGNTLNTAAIQTAVDTATIQASGTVLVPSGDYVIGAIYLKNHVSLILEPGSTLLGSRDLIDYPQIPSQQHAGRQKRHLVVARNAHNIAISGQGTIDGQGEAATPGG